MYLIIVIAISIVFGFFVAEIWHRMLLRKDEEIRQRNSRIAEYFNKQLWQFISIDEWLRSKN